MAFVPIPIRFHDVRVPSGWRRAMTLVEMVVVLVLVGVLAGSVVVALEGRQSDRALKIAAADLATAIRFAVQQSNMNHRPHRIVFDEERKSFRVEHRVSENVLAFESVRGLAGEYKVLPRDVTIAEISTAAYGEGDHTVLVFGPGEQCFNGMIELINGRGDYARLAVNGVTGQVDVHGK